jgi:ribose transport system ATP-binding protein
MDSLLVLEGIWKAFPGVQALSNVSLDVAAGEIHGLVGENGAGKSTLVAIAAGVLQQDSGTVWIHEQALVDATPQKARRLGVAIVHQVPALLPHLTVGENLYIGVTADRRPSLGRLSLWASPQLDRWEPDRIDPALRAAWLAGKSRFIVEITKALAQDPSILILDEPTEHLDGDDIDLLFDTVRAGAHRGWAVIYISHRIREVKQIAHRITVLRDGKSRGTFVAGDLSESEVVNLIVGRPVETAFPSKEGSRRGETVLHISSLASEGFSHLNMSVAAGEIVGLAGIDGNGQREVARALAGLTQSTGLIWLNGGELRNGRPHLARNAGIVYIPRDRHGEALFQGLVVRENLAVGSLRSLARFGFIRRKLESRYVARLLAAFGIRAKSPEAAIETLSGGNQQKVVLARTIGGDASALVADGPSQGVDVGARVDIYRLIQDFANDGSAVVMVSSDGIELAGLCDRVLVFSRGRVVGTLSGDGLTEHAITSTALTATAGKRDETTSRKLRTLRVTGSDMAPSIALGLAVVLLGTAAATTSDFYLTGLNLRGLLALLATLVFVSLGQQIVLMTGGIDLSVGPLMGFLVVVASFFLTSQDPMGPMWVGWALIVAGALVVGAINWSLVDVVGLHPVIATLATFMALRGLSLVLRPVPGGLIDDRITDGISSTVGFVPVAILVAIATTASLEYALRRTWWGVMTRAIGSDPRVSRDLGVPSRSVRFLAYVSCALLTALAAVLLMAQVGSGNPRAGVDYTLTSIAAVLLGGTSIFGGRGSFVSTFMGALLLQQIIVATTFLGLGPEWRSFLLGGLTLVAVAAYSKVRSLAPSL